MMKNLKQKEEIEINEKHFFESLFNFMCFNLLLILLFKKNYL